MVKAASDRQENDQKDNAMNIILASKSPRRRELLEMLGLEFTIKAAEKEETMIPGRDVAQEVARVSTAKAMSVPRDPQDLVIASDTVVELDGQVLGKPHSQDEAFQMLKSLSGRTHQVHTAITLLRGQQLSSRVSTTAVTFRTLTDGEIRAYIATGEPMDKAGAYGAQGIGALLVERIDGDFFTVMGLPVSLLGQSLKEFGINLLSDDTL